MGLYLLTKFQVSSIILTSFRQRGRGGGGGNFTPPPNPPQKETQKSQPRLGLSRESQTLMLRKIFDKETFPQSCLGNIYHLFGWCFEMKINGFLK